MLTTVYYTLHLHFLLAVGQRSKSLSLQSCVIDFFVLYLMIMFFKLEASWVFFIREQCQ